MISDRSHNYPTSNLAVQHSILGLSRWMTTCESAPTSLLNVCHMKGGWLYWIEGAAFGGWGKVCFTG